MPLSDFTRRKIRHQYEILLKRWLERSYEAYKAGEEWLPEYRFHEAEQDVRGQIDRFPEAIQTAFRYYLEHVENADFGSVRLRQVPTLPVPTIAVRVTTDGDDGWLEVYALDGQRIGAGRMYAELVGWGGYCSNTRPNRYRQFFSQFSGPFWTNALGEISGKEGGKYLCRNKKGYLVP